MAVLFRPFFPVDKTHWAPLLAEELSDMDFRVYPDVGDPAAIEYYITWNLFPGDRTAYPNLKAILSLRAGVDWFVGHPETPEGVRFVRMIDPGLTESMREYVAAYVLRLHRELIAVECCPEKTGDWHVQIPKRASERTVGIMGLGHLGSACAEVLKPFGFRLKGWSRSKKASGGIETFAGLRELDDFLAGTDILVCLLPLTSETENILNRETLLRLPRGAALINVARGRHVVDEDLIALLDEGHLSHAVLDVFRKEPLTADHPFLHHPNVTATPHLSGTTIPATGTRKLRETILAIQRGEEPEGLVRAGERY